MYTCYLAEQHFPSLKDAFAHFSRLGVEEADILDFELENLPLADYCRALRSAKIKPGAVVSCARIISPDKYERIAETNRVKSLIDEASREKIPTIMLAPSVEYGMDLAEMKDIMLSSYGEICEYANTRGIRSAIENQSSKKRSDSRTNDVCDILKSIPNLDFILDFGNFFCIGEDVLKAYALLRERTVRAHVKDWTYANDGNMTGSDEKRFCGTAIGDGFLPCSKLISLMKKDRLDVSLVLEINSKKVTLDMLERSAIFLKNQI